VPQARYLDAQGRTLPRRRRSGTIAFTDYVIAIRPGIRYQPHPAFARAASGEHAYHALSARDLAGIVTRWRTSSCATRAN
jgi:oligopeptide transport system substrate-binding protein